MAQVRALSTSQAVIEFDLDGTIITANQNFLDATDLHPGLVQSDPRPHGQPFKVVQYASDITAQDCPQTQREGPRHHGIGCCGRRAARCLGPRDRRGDGALARECLDRGRPGGHRGPASAPAEPGGGIHERDLANQAKQATDKIEQEVGNLNGISGHVVGALGSIKKAIQEVSEYVTSTAVALEQQSAVTSEMPNGMQRAAAEAASIGIAAQVGMSRQK